MQGTESDGRTVVRSYRECHEILRSQKFVGSAGRPEGRAFLGDSVLLVDGAEHRARRQLYLPLMREGTLKRFESDVIGPVLETAMRTHLEPGPDGAKRGDLVVLVRDVCMRAAAALIGFDNYADESAARRLFELLGPLAAGATVEWSERDHATVIREGLEAKAAYVAEFFAPAWERRTAPADGSPDDRRVDLLAIMADHFQPHWDADLPVRESILFLAGSTGNPVGQIVYAFDDLWQWRADHPEDDPLGDEAFLRAAIDETLRLHIAGSPVLTRTAVEDTVLSSTGRVVHAGEVLALDMVGANRDPEVFGETPERYDPHRSATLPDRVAPYGVAFGGGAHVCIGRPLVLGAGMRVDTLGLEFQVLTTLLRQGVEPDPDRAPALTTGGQVQFASYPVCVATAERASDRGGGNAAP